MTRVSFLSLWILLLLLPCLRPDHNTLHVTIQSSRDREAPTTMNKVFNEDPPSYDAILPNTPPVTYPISSYTPDTAPVIGVPPELQCLLQINQISLREKFSVSQRMGRSFDVLDHVGQRMYQANQNVQCCGPLYDLRVQDNQGGDAMVVLEPCGCTCTRQMEVTVPSAGVIGSVTLHMNAFITHLSIMNPSKEVTLLILGPSFQTNIFGNVSFEVKSRDEQYVVGMIRSEGNQYSVSFPMDLSVSMKAMLLTSCFYLESLIHSKRLYVATRQSSN